MNLKRIFAKAEEPLLSIYCTSGYPKVDSLPIILEGLKEAGVDFVEVGMPYSDPLSDGPTIQNSSSIAIENGITTDMIFDQIANSPVDIPKIMMGYFNAAYIYGIEKFCKRCANLGVEGVILPDLPIGLYLSKYKSIFERYDIHMIFLVTPETSEDRIRYIDEHSSSFIYAVSSSSTTGTGTGITSSEDYLQRLKNMNLTHPFMVGFNISNHEDFTFASKYAAGGIIGSAFIKHIADSKDLKRDINQFVKSIKGK